MQRTSVPRPGPARRRHHPFHSFHSFHPYLTDGALAALVLFATSLQFLFPHEGDDRLSPIGFLLGAGTAVPLAWRRRAPMLSVYLVSVFTPAMAVYRAPPPDVAYGGLVALYTLAVVGKPVQRRVVLATWLIGATATMTFRERAEPFEYAFHLLSFVSAYGFGVLARVQRAYTAALEDRALRLERERAGETARAVARERARIARDMHDVVAHAVSVMVVQAEAGPVVVRADPGRAERAFEAIGAAGRDAMEQLRRILGVLREADGDGSPDGGRGPQPALAALPALLARVEQAGVTVRLKESGETRPLAADVDVAAYRLAQEALTNVLKHARASLVTVEVAWSPRELALTVTDDGTGAARGTGGGYGLVGIRERAAACGGRVDVGPAAGGGFRVAARLPTASLAHEHPRGGGRRPGAGAQRLRDDP
ncbi:sensor histidine kinase [Streptomyces sp. MNP-20]|uniref:sensor histidine kinase n=1 Tax=Streptomyces sp. MNP-20 TaxID=2721165 RepID=UPI001553F6D8|nr:histidine kinase [Streptomyces sp. MNP-20]